MSFLASLGVYDRSADWRFIYISLLLSFLIYYPIYLWISRIRRTQRIRRQLITSAYKPPLDMSPVDTAYVFSKKIATRHIYSTLLHLTNRGVLHMYKDRGITYLEIGPKVDKNLLTYEKMLVGIVHSAKVAVALDDVIKGDIEYALTTGEKINGNKAYVFWRLLRQSLIDRGLIKKRMTTYYLKLVIFFGGGASLIMALFPLLFVRLVQMNMEGRLDTSRLNQTVMSSVSIWVLVLPVTLIVSFFLLLLRGRMLGRRWILTNKSLRYLGQFVVFREFVWLAQRKKLHFDTTVLARESAVANRPYAIAFGYIKKY